MAPNDESNRDQKSAPQTTPTFSIYDAAFKSILGPSPSLTLLLEKEYAFAHEAGVFIEATNELFITSNRLVDKTGQQTVEVSKISLEGSPKCEVIKCDQLVMANGGVNYEHNRILFCTQGSASQPSGLFLMDVEAPHGTELMVAGFYGRPFNSVNDVVVHSDGSVWFTDPIYGYEQGYRPKPRLPNQVYRYEPRTGDIRVVADGFGRPNGICFSPDERTVYVTDTDWIHGDGTTDDSRPSTIYAMDVAEYSGGAFLINRRVFAMAAHGIPDGIKCDMAGNVYSGCGDGVNVWSPAGRLLGKMLIQGGVANFCFGRPGELFLLNETKIWRATVSEEVRGDLLRL